MKVSELIEVLQKMPETAEVQIWPTPEYAHEFDINHIALLTDRDHPVVMVYSI